MEVEGAAAFSRVSHLLSSEMLNVALFLLGLVFSSDVLASSSSSGSAPNIVDVGYASYLGNQSYPNTVAYLGIPYAEPPLAELRWRAPLPLNTTRISQESNRQVINATTYPMFCVQGSIGGGDHGGAGSEDCLKVNIYAPAGAKEGDNLPVLFYIHGGGYVYGNPRNWPFDPWINQSPNIVIVSVYYRLDSFGFLSHPDFVDASIGDFNGQSAGGSSVELHMVAHEDEGLFSGAIAQSVFRGPVSTPKEQLPLFDFYSSYAGCGDGTTAAQMTCLRNVSQESHRYSCTYGHINIYECNSHHYLIAINGVSSSPSRSWPNPFCIVHI
ncbi:hypothetical protein SERLADRAFT_464104 [Serpula lacrymans var. lacrymans S7.9]|uniref:Carboxylesterase type B domain-containing protein n=1 Tax=Serpula lacrymans var. lacrymans (strain S7.9) TaxID=578457 RepID=F8NR81_SERL9|nr:uncharacterized protein SERLADRAFT_464104 [Serpula lacrymans var. lacrymans S7.9]EGO26728.1 hypothetical protein SERLADRAFT_464104 [Serpula lacrymans var. lacrymans S7.9]